jgi:hypothetical protein
LRYIGKWDNRIPSQQGIHQWKDETIQVSQAGVEAQR